VLTREVVDRADLGELVTATGAAAEERAAASTPVAGRVVG
jgi:hypothetical protein